MNIMHHPSEIVLAEYANGTLDEAAALVVGVHVAQCPECRQKVRQFEAIGGAMLDQPVAREPMKITADALLNSAFADVGPRRFTDSAVAERAPDRRNATKSGSPADRMLSLYRCGDWRWIGPGVHWRSFSVPSDHGIRVFMLRARAGTALPHHRHSGIEWTCVLEGAFEHQHGRFGPGDFDEADSSMDHNPVVEKGDDCVCLVAMTGRLEMQGLIGRILQPFVRL